MKNNYEPYYEIEAVGCRIGLQKCLRCGATVIISSDGIDAEKLHDEWHKLNNPTP